ncbi:Ger(x)C family spore germination protein [Sporolactobacillus sp. CPB3-1]|uniref:Ger(X)C family spore germination protein n=1 Tax=Sporolactobacillus mangiferae TaxID=2940498 RepID=A0ABT0MD32_9BACL|nr:Ger(x)C family spore germination protein [Sporolactobacillus mangiferae]MCL1632772.1 Ger(x)C family spore germination protein [Sporolactobacillus mangiferae]
MKIKVFFLLMLIPLLSGCLPTSTLDQVLMVEGEGFDYLGNGKIMGTVVIPSFEQGASQNGQGGGMQSISSTIRSLSGVTYDGKSLADKFQSEGQEILRVGSMKTMIYDKKLAKFGLKNQLSFRNRDPDVPSAISIAVVDGSTKELLTATDYQTKVPIARYIQHMILQNTQQNYPSTNLRYFLDSYYGAYMDPFMPLIKKSGDHLEMQGLALFRNDKYIMSIPDSKMFVFKMLYEPFNQGFYDCLLPSGKHIVVRNVESSVKYKVEDGNGVSPKVVASLQIKGYVRQASPKTVSTKAASTVSKKVADDLKHNAEKMVRQLQRKGVDPLRIGDTVRSATRHFDGKTWNERYPNTNFSCQIHVEVIQTGISS